MLIADASMTPANSASCCQIACSAFQCPSGKSLITDASTTAGADVTTCCASLCSAFTCPSHYVLIQNAETAVGKDTSSCCIGLCSGLQCHAGYTHVANAAEISGDHQNCCEVACSSSSFRCPAGYLKIADAATTAGNDANTCCESSCGRFSCPTDYLPIASPATTVGSSTEVCCDPACSSFQCPSGYLKIAEPEVTKGSDAQACCDASCSLFQCVTNYLQIENATTKAGVTADVCCDLACSGVQCPADYVAVADAATKRGEDAGTCCDALCSAFKCPTGYQAIGSSSTVVGSSIGQCCDSLCSAVKCAAGYITKPDRITAVGSTQEFCCQEAELGFCQPPVLGTGLEERKVAFHARTQQESTVCDRQNPPVTDAMMTSYCDAFCQTGGEKVSLPLQLGAKAFGFNLDSMNQICTGTVGEFNASQQEFCRVRANALIDMELRAADFVARVEEFKMEQLAFKAAMKSKAAELQERLSSEEFKDEMATARNKVDALKSQFELFAADIGKNSTSGQYVKDGLDALKTSAQLLTISVTENLERFEDFLNNCNQMMLARGPLLSGEHCVHRNF